MELHGSGTQALQVFNLPPCQQPAVEAGRVPAWPLNVVAVDGGLISATGAVHPLVPLIAHHESRMLGNDGPGAS